MLTPRSDKAPVQVHRPGEAAAAVTSSGRILIVDDDEILSRFLQRFLTLEGFSVQSVQDGASALDALGPEVDCLILDLNMPNLDGLGVLQRLRPVHPELPVLVLTARQRSESAALSLESGADDCLTKPFSCAELLARIRALLRRNHRGGVPQNSQCADLAIFRNELRVMRNGQRIHLTPREYGLLEYLMRTPRRPVSRAVLLKELWGGDGDVSSNVVDVYMKYVRDKVDLPGMPKLIRTVRGLGYAVNEH